MITKIFIDKEKIINNIEKIMQINKNIIYVLKDDAYGLGIEHILPIIASHNDSINESSKDIKIAVSSIEEAMKAFKISKKINKNIIIITINSVEAKDIVKIIENNIEITIYSYFQLNEYISYLSKLNKVNDISKISIHIKLNTGMNRLGFDKSDLHNLFKIIKQQKLNIKSIFSHILNAENETSTNSQIKLFDEMIFLFKENKIKFDYTHIQASPSLFQYKSKYNYDYARVGMALYGLQPLSKKINLENPIKLASKVIQIRELNKGEFASYGNNILKENKKIAIVPIGYAHGLPKQIENSSPYVLINGEKASLIGEVCMDMILVDVTEIKNININDEVTIIGRDGDLEITVLDVAKWANTIQDDVLVKFGLMLRNSK